MDAPFDLRVSRSRLLEREGSKRLKLLEGDGKTPISRLQVARQTALWALLRLTLQQYRYCDVARFELYRILSGDIEFKSSDEELERIRELQLTIRHALLDRAKHIIDTNLPGKCRHSPPEKGNPPPITLFRSMPLMKKVFSFLHGEDLLSVISKVSKWLRYLVFHKDTPLVLSDPNVVMNTYFLRRLWKNDLLSHVVRVPTCPTFELVAIICMLCPNVQDVSLSVRVGPGDFARQQGTKWGVLALRKYHKVTRIALEGMGVGLHDLISVFPQCPKLKELRLRNAGINDALLDRILSSIKDIQSLEVLEVSHSRTGNEGAEKLAKFLLSHDRMKVLSLHDNQIGPDGWLALCGVIEELRSLEELNVHNNSIGNTLMSSLCGLLPQSQLSTLFMGNNGFEVGAFCQFCPSLTSSSLSSLDVSSSRLNTTAAIELCSVLSSSANGIRSISFADNGAGDEGAAAFADFVSSRPNFTHLNLSGNSITEKGAVSLAKCWTEGPGCSELCIADNRIGDDGFCILINAMESSHNLCALNAARIDIGTKCAKCICDLIDNSPKLISLDLRGNSLTFSAVVSIIGTAMRYNQVLRFLQVEGNRYDMDDNGLKLDSDWSRMSMLEGNLMERFKRRDSTTIEHYLKSIVFDKRIPASSYREIRFEDDVQEAL